MSTSLTFTHLRFDATARTPLKLGGFQAGERLRDALAQVMLRTVCTETHRAAKPTPEHAAGCPVCWLLAADLDPGEVRRVYSLVPPLPGLDMVEPGQSFSFVLTLYGQGWQYLPYFVLAVPAMGEVGVGPGRGQFDLQAIWAANPLAAQMVPVLKPGENVVRAAGCPLSWTDVLQNSCHAMLDGSKGRLAIKFYTPTRLVDGERLVKAPDFGVFFRRMLERLDELARQHAGAEHRAAEDIERLYTLADQVRLVESDVHWVDLWGPSGRTGRKTPMGGFTGTAVYRARDWAPLLPWMVLGQGIQVGKLAVKGNGVYALPALGRSDYWQWLMNERYKEV